MDEPSTAQFPLLANVTATIRQLYPQALAFINLLPTYASPQQMGAPNYTEYVRQYMAVVKPQVEDL